MVRKFLLVTAFWLTASLSIKTSIDVFVGSKTWDLSFITGNRNMLSGCINTFITSSKRAFNQCRFTGVDKETPDFASKWKVSEDPNAPEWMERGVLLP